MFKDSISNKKAVSIHQNALIISLSDVKEPVLWRLSLDAMADVKFTVSALDDGRFALVFNQNKENEKVLGHFVDKEKAKEILANIQHELVSYSEDRKKKGAGYVFFVLQSIISLSVVIAAILLGITLLTPSKTDAELEQLLSLLAQGTEEVDVSNPEITEEMLAGQPVDADDFFQNFEENNN